jgi:hypothetical protein
VKQINLFSFITTPNNQFKVPVSEHEIDLGLFFENKNEEYILHKLAQKRRISLQTCKILYNLYFNSVFIKVTTSNKKTIVLSPYFKFYKIK